MSFASTMLPDTAGVGLSPTQSASQDSPMGAGGSKRFLSPRRLSMEGRSQDSPQKILTPKRPRVQAASSLETLISAGCCSVTEDNEYVVDDPRELGYFLENKLMLNSDLRRDFLGALEDRLSDPESLRQALLPMAARTLVRTAPSVSRAVGVWGQYHGREPLAHPSQRNLLANASGNHTPGEASGIYGKTACLPPRPFSNPAMSFRECAPPHPDGR
eukprot:2235444-Pyramimonas_sp.AAC.1